MCFTQIILFIVCLPSLTPSASTMRLGTWLHSLFCLLLDWWLAHGGAQSFSTEWLWLMSIHFSSVSSSSSLEGRYCVSFCYAYIWCIVGSIQLGWLCHHGPPKASAPLSALWGVRAGCPWAQPGNQSLLGKQAWCNQNFPFVKRIWSLVWRPLRF